jgi:hypothetical protein
MPGPWHHALWRPLQRVSMSSRPPTIHIEFGDGSSLDVSDPQAVLLDARADGAERLLEIEDANGERVRVMLSRHHPPAEIEGPAAA